MEHERSAMRIGVVSDTHNHVANVARIVELFRGAGVDRIVHTGDITQPKVLDMLATAGAPVFGVFGNNDEGEQERLSERADALGIELAPPPATLVWHERRIVVVHDPKELTVDLAAEHDLVLHGHTHRTTIERSEGRLVFNPGECAGHLAGRNTVGVVCLERLEPELLHF